MDPRRRTTSPSESSSLCRLSRWRNLWEERGRAILFLELGARALELHGCGAESFRNVLIAGKALQVNGVEHGKHVQGDVERRLGIVDEVADDSIVLAESAIAGYEAKDLICQARHRSEGLDFLIGEARGLQH